MRKTTNQIETFDKWFASYLGGSKPEVVKELLEDNTAVRFLIAWSILESIHLKNGGISQLAREISARGDLEISKLMQIGEYFHKRYQDNEKYRNLMHRNSCGELEAILKKCFTELNVYEHVFLVLYVVYRYRNNIFHGNKGVESWLAYRHQIKLCTDCMQILIAHNNSQERTE